MNLMPPGTPKVYFSSYFVPSGRLLLEGSRAFQSKTLHMLLTMKNVAKDVIFAR